MKEENLLNVNEMQKLDDLLILNTVELNTILLKRLLLLVLISIGISSVAVLLLLILILR